MGGLISRSDLSVRARELLALLRVAGEKVEGKAEVLGIPEALRIRDALRRTEHARGKARVRVVRAHGSAKQSLVKEPPTRIPHGEIRR